MISLVSKIVFGWVVLSARNTGCITCKMIMYIIQAISPDKDYKISITSPLSATEVAL